MIKHSYGTMKVTAEIMEASESKPGDFITVNMSDREKRNLARYSAMRAVGDRVLVRPERDLRGEELTSGGIIIPSTTKRSKEHREGVVLSAGPRVRHIKVGERVLWLTRLGQFADGMYGYDLMSLLEDEISAVLGGGK